MKFVSRLNRSIGLSEGVIGRSKHVSRVTRGTNWSGWMETWEALKMPTYWHHLA